MTEFFIQADSPDYVVSVDFSFKSIEELNLFVSILESMGCTCKGSCYGDF